MDIVILCGGRGLRLGKVTKKVPKPLVIINERPILSYILDQIDLKEVGKVFICTGYKSKNFENYLNQIELKNINTTISKGHWTWDTGRRLLELKDKLSNNFIILYGDNYINFSFYRYLDLLNKKKYSFSLFLQNAKRCNDGYGNVNIKNKNKVKIYSDIRDNKFKYSDLGYIKCTKKLFNYYDKRNNNESLTLILNRLTISEDVHCIVTKNKFITITDQEKLKYAKMYFKKIKYLNSI